jgi:pseudouridine-5'-phosphate glycosidase
LLVVFLDQETAKTALALAALAFAAAALAATSLAATAFAAALGGLDIFDIFVDVGGEHVGAAEVDGVDSGIAELSYGIFGIVNLRNDGRTKTLELAFLGNTEGEN